MFPRPPTIPILPTPPRRDHQAEFEESRARLEDLMEQVETQRKKLAQTMEELRVFQAKLKQTTDRNAQRAESAK